MMLWQIKPSKPLFYFVNCVKWVAFLLFGYIINDVYLKAFRLLQVQSISAQDSPKLPV